MGDARRLGANRFLHAGREHVYVSYPRDGFTCPPELTAAEAQIAALIVRGSSPAEIARARGVSPRTVANQLAAIYRKLGVSSRSELVFALQR